MLQEAFARERTAPLFSWKPAGREVIRAGQLHEDLWSFSKQWRKTARKKINHQATLTHVDADMHDLEPTDQAVWTGSPRIALLLPLLGYRAPPPRSVTVGSLPVPYGLTVG
jgi:hypothetical protein